MKRQNLLKALDGQELLDFMKSYQPSVLNKSPFTERELLVLYCEYTDPLLQLVRTINSDNVFTLGNEARAMVGHLADYGLNQSNKKNLSDAYGHFRRLNLDAFKIICDKLDSFLFGYLDTHWHYDYSRVNANFLSEYTKRYYSAQKAYLLAQTTERTGSDRLANNIIEEYFNAANLYAELFTYLQNNRSGIEFAKWKSEIAFYCKTIILILGVFQSLFSWLS